MAFFFVLWTQRGVWASSQFVCFEHRGKENGEWGRGTHFEYVLCASTVLSDLNALVSFQFTCVRWVVVTLILQKKTDSLWWTSNRTGVETFIWLALMYFPLDHLGHTLTLSAQRRNWTRFPLEWHSDRTCNTIGARNCLQRGHQLWSLQDYLSDLQLWKQGHILLCACCGTVFIPHPQARSGQIASSHFRDSLSNE